MTDQEPRPNSPAQLPALPHRYTRVYDPQLAMYKEARKGPYRTGTTPPPPKTDQEIIERIARDVKASEWYYTDYWREKGVPIEQVEMQIGDHPITVYNYNSEIPFTDEHAQKMAHILSEFGSRFPRVLEKLRWILIDNIQPGSYYGDSENYPANGQAAAIWRAFKMYPRSMSFTPHRITTATNFEGTAVHELTHIIDEDFENAGWKEKYKWELCMHHPEDWEYRDVPDGGSKAYYNKQTGKMALVDQYPLQPDECVNEYAKQNIDDDVCESMVAYFFDPDLLERTSPTKFRIIKSLDQGLPKPPINVKRVPNSEIGFPVVSAPQITYYIYEPPTA